MRQFLILFDDITIDTASVKAGNNSPEIITAARCVNVGLFISGNLRRDVVVTLAKGTPEDLVLISFPGESLRRVSPDERSISFFLLKALTIADELLMDAFKKMDNGIEIERSSLKDFLDSLDSTRVYLSTPDAAPDSVDNAKYEDSLLIYSKGRQLDLVQEDVAWKQEKLPYPPHPERFILDVNMATDMKKAS